MSVRYHKLLVRCVQFAAVKLTKSRFLSDDHKLFIAHMYTALFFRFPSTAPKLLTAVLDTTATLERTDADHEGDDVPAPSRRSLPLSLSPSRLLPRLHVTTVASSDAKRPRRKSTLRGYRSPRNHNRSWHAFDTDCVVETADYGAQIAQTKHRAFAAFIAYKTSRGTNDLLAGGQQPVPFKKGVRSADAHLELAFQQVQ